MSIPATWNKDTVNEIYIPFSGVGKLYFTDGHLVLTVFQAVLEYYLNGSEDADRIVDDLREDGFYGLQKACSCIGYSFGCSDCETSSRIESEVFFFTNHLIDNLKLTDESREFLRSSANRKGHFEVVLEVMDMETIIIKF